MDNINKHELDLDDPSYLQILNRAQNESSTLLCVALIKLDGSNAICSNSDNDNINQKIDTWLSLARNLFASQNQHSAGIPLPLHQATKIFSLHFDKDYFIGLRHEESQKNIAILLTDENHIGQAMRSVATVLENEDLCKSQEKYACFDRSGSRSPSELSTKGNAGHLCGSEDCANIVLQSFLSEASIPPLAPTLSQCNIDISALNEVYFDDGDHRVLYKRIRFLPDYVFIIAGQTDTKSEHLSMQLRDCTDNLLRYHINEILKAGIITDLSLAPNDISWQHIVQEIRGLDKDDLISHLEVGGFANHSLGEQVDMADGDFVLRCAECIYYYPNRKWCDLPELPVPVEEHWYCKLWKI
jgi:hypothetical protein